MSSDFEPNETLIRVPSSPAIRTIHRLTLGWATGQETQINTPDPTATLTHDETLRQSVMTSNRSEIRIFWDRVAYLSWQEIDLPADKPKPEPIAPTRRRIV